jgi:predicted DNA-binding ribbon-helix-helix protein
MTASDSKTSQPTDAVNVTEGIIKRSVVIAGHRTSISLENIFWRELQKAARSEGLSLAAKVAQIDASRGALNLSSAIRVRMLEAALDRASFTSASEL